MPQHADASPAHPDHPRALTCSPPSQNSADAAELLPECQSPAQHKIGYCDSSLPDAELLMDLLAHGSAAPMQHASPAEAEAERNASRSCSQPLQPDADDPDPTPQSSSAQQDLAGVPTLDDENGDARHGEQLWSVSAGHGSPEAELQSSSSPLSIPSSPLAPGTQQAPDQPCPARHPLGQVQQRQSDAHSEANVWQPSLPAAASAPQHRSHALSMSTKQLSSPVTIPPDAARPPADQLPGGSVLEAHLVSRHGHLPVASCDPSPSRHDRRPRQPAEGAQTNKASPSAAAAAAAASVLTPRPEAAPEAPQSSEDSDCVLLGIQHATCAAQQQGRAAAVKVGPGLLLPCSWPCHCMHDADPGIMDGFKLASVD